MRENGNRLLVKEANRLKAADCVSNPRTYMM